MGKQETKRAKSTWVNSAPGLILIDSAFCPIASNKEGAAILAYAKDSDGKSAESLRIPEEMLEAIRRHRSNGRQSLVIPFQAGRRRYVCHAFPISCSQIPAAQPIFALILQRNSSADETISRAAAQFNLTERERETLCGISLGLSSKELAERMQISPSTVKAYLHLVMVKMGVTSRAGIIAKILEQSSAC
jgi:DNA-binding CsgD family transcriptional regulator